MSTKCRNCTGPKKGNQILCKPCWDALPAALRTAFHTAPDHESRRVAICKIYDHANGTPSFL